MIIESIIFWDVMPCSSVEAHQCFRGMYCHCLQGQQVKCARSREQAGCLSHSATLKVLQDYTALQGLG
jgi:hypothetical protein